MPILRAWETFFFIIGSSAAALTGLQFVVIALTSERRTSGDTSAVDAFGTPTIVHFCAVLTTSALITMPGHSPRTLGSAFAALGIFGVVYTLVTARRAKRQELYVPVFEDWLWHVGFPLASYGIFFVAGLAAFSHVVGALYFMALAAMLLLFTGIHNAWDSAVYISTRQ